MHLNKFQTYRDNLHDESYWFYSEGPKGRIRKVVQFQKTENPYIYNLALGDDDGTNTILPTYLITKTRNRF
ncbi:MAG: hypothetical protein JWQ09_4909 [Segetibacter sp.]|nr:hypothetical protein [Segetibacter sp.]